MKRCMLVSVELDADFSKLCAGGESGSLLPRRTPRCPSRRLGRRRTVGGCELCAVCAYDPTLPLAKLEASLDELACYVGELPSLRGVGGQRARRAVVEDDLDGLLTWRLPLQIAPRGVSGAGERTEQEQASQEFLHWSLPSAMAFSTSPRAFRIS